MGAYGYAVRARGVRDSGGAGASLIGLFPWKFPEGRISQDMFISKGISRNLHQGQHPHHPSPHLRRTRTSRASPSFNGDDMILPLLVDEEAEPTFKLVPFVDPIEMLRTNPTCCSVRRKTSAPPVVGVGGGCVNHPNS